jgi:hypothetical protein
MSDHVAQQNSAFWLRIADFVVLAMRLRDGILDDVQAGLSACAGSGSQHLPLLDWPPNLFEDEPLLGR